MPLLFGERCGRDGPHTAAQPAFTEAMADCKWGQVHPDPYPLSVAQMVTHLSLDFSFGTAQLSNVRRSQVCVSLLAIGHEPTQCFDHPATATDCPFPCRGERERVRGALKTRRSYDYSGGAVRTLQYRGRRTCFAPCPTGLSGPNRSRIHHRHLFGRSRGEE